MYLTDLCVVNGGRSWRSAAEAEARSTVKDRGWDGAWEDVGVDVVLLLL